jgi:hypothetical protein
MVYDPNMTTTTPVPSDRWNCVCDMATWPVPCPNHNRRRQTVSQPSEPMTTTTTPIDPRPWHQRTTDPQRRSQPSETTIACTCGYSGTTQLRHGQPHQTVSQPSRPPMHIDPPTNPPTADSGDDNPISEHVPKPLADAVAAVHLANQARERQQLIHDLANSNPFERRRRHPYCHHCRREQTKGHHADCLWVRARQLTNQPEQP